MKNIFDKTVSDEVIARIQNLNPDSRVQGGKMTVDQMLAHCNVTYELIYDNKHPKPTGLKKLLLKWFVKNLVVSEKPYKRNNPTATEFLVTSRRDFELEQGRLIAYIQKHWNWAKTILMERSPIHSEGSKAENGTTCFINSSIII